MIGHIDGSFDVIPVLRFDDDNVSDAAPFIDEADAAVDNDSRLINSDDE